MNISESIRLYHSLKLHFNKDQYDYFKYNGTTKLKAIQPGHIGFYQLITNRYKDLETFYVSNFIEYPTIWLDELVTEDSYDRYMAYVKRHQSLSYTIKSDIKTLLDNYEIDELLTTKGELPIIVKNTLQNKISLETFVLLCEVFNLIPRWNEIIMDDLVWKPFVMKCVKFLPFIKYDTKIVTTIQHTFV